MSVVVVGLAEPQTPLELLERVAVGDDALGKVLTSLRDRSNFSEVVVLSTCLRTEVYAVVERFHEGVAELQEFLATTARASAEELAEHVTVLFDDDVTVHLFEVAAGLRSAVLGETEVLGQVRRAAERAESERAAGPVLSGLFRHAVKTGRRVRSATAIARGSTSLSHVAVELAESELRGELVDKRVVVVGAGEMAEGVVRALDGRGARCVSVVNRTASRAKSLAKLSGGKALALGALPQVLADAHVVFVSTGAPEHVLDAQMVLGSLTSASRRSSSLPSHEKDVSDVLGGAHANGTRLLIVDMGMPRNVDPSVGALAGVALLDIEDLNSHAERALAGRRAELEDAREIVHQEVERYRADERARGAAPVVSALRQRLEQLVQLEMHRHGSRLAGLDAGQRREVEAVLRDVVAKLAHPPTVALKETAGTPRGERLVEALRTLFEL